MKKRKCGDCTVCCTVLEVREGLDKPGWTPCKFQVGRGCLIYSERPKPCKDYECVWLAAPLEWQQVLGHKQRPDRVGIVVDVQDIGPARVYAAKEITPGAAQSVRAKALIQKLSNFRPVLIVDQNARVQIATGDDAAREYLKGLIRLHMPGAALTAGRL